MNPFTALNHVLNFFAPALFVAWALALAGHMFWRKLARAQGWWVPLLVNLAVGCAVLVAGLVFFERDGKMLTYAALVLACASSQWLVLRAWRG